MAYGTSISSRTPTNKLITQVGHVLLIHYYVHQCVIGNVVLDEVRTILVTYYKAHVSMYY